MGALLHSSTAPTVVVYSKEELVFLIRDYPNEVIIINNLGPSTQPQNSVIVKYCNTYRRFLLTFSNRYADPQVFGNRFDYKSSLKFARVYARENALRLLARVLRVDARSSARASIRAGAHLDACACASAGSHACVRVDERANVHVGHMPVCFDHTTRSDDGFVLHIGGQATIMKFVTEIATTALEFCKPFINSRLAWCFIAEAV
ncbi:hypothetical protein EVAR_49338_1 [Eumeta japonica]|uniref:Uncharacterized protein n=1 Tax=Eumeta variegata TaxID=151549 RepID=A0A4C1XXQ6_EUMVA|nr:hypothetical protein EVAR_49338_1 [Eumeta japonica]